MSQASEPFTSFPRPFDGAECLNADVYAELRKMAARRMADWGNDSTLQPTVLVHEAWLRLSRRNTPWLDRGHFFAGAVLAMRHILIDHARRKARLRRGGDLSRSNTITLSEFAVPDQDERLLLIDEAVQALEAVDPLCAQVVVARFFGGLTTEEIAQSLCIGARSVDRSWAKAKVWLFRWMQNATRA